MTQIAQTHEALRVQLMNRMRAAGSREEVLKYQWELEDAQRERRREMRQAQSIRWDGVVQWPGPGGGDGAARRVAEKKRQSREVRGPSRLEKKRISVEFVVDREHE
jgi:hypothetical protein